MGEKLKIRGSGNPRMDGTQLWGIGILDKPGYFSWIQCGAQTAEIIEAAFAESQGTRVQMLLETALRLKEQEEYEAARLLEEAALKLG